MAVGKVVVASWAVGKVAASWAVGKAVGMAVGKAVVAGSLVAVDLGDQWK